MSTGSDGPVADTARYEALVGDLAAALGPGPGDTSPLGLLGWSVSCATSHTSSSAPSLAQQGLSPSQIIVRKGLPLALEVDVGWAWLPDQDLWAPSLALRSVLISEADATPGVGIRLHAGAMLGHPDMDLLVAGADLIISKRFPIAGLLRVTPYAGYNLTVGRGSSRPIAVISAAGVEPTTAVMPSRYALLQRAIIGLQVDLAGLICGVEASLGDRTSWALHLGIRL